MKDTILEWLGVIKDEDLHLYEEYIPTKEEKRREFIIQCGVLLFIAIGLLGWPLTYYRLQRVHTVSSDLVLTTETHVFSQSFIARKMAKVGDGVLVKVSDLEQVYGSIYEIDEDEVTIENNGVARISVPKSQIIGVKIDHFYGKFFSWLINHFFYHRF